MVQDIPISVIVPVYNVEKYLARCIESIQNQTHRNVEIILVDDGSKDSSGSICDAFAAADSRIRVIHKENGGLSSARNAGIDVASGEYLAFVDSDDWIEPDAYEGLLEQALKNDVKLVVGGRFNVEEATGEKTVGLCPVCTERISGEEMVRRIFTWDHCDSSACDKLYHRSLFADKRFPLGKVCEDVPIMYLIVLDAQWVVMHSKPFYNYFHRAGSITVSSVSEKTFHFSQHTEGICEYIRENHPQLMDAARYLRIRSLYFNVHVLEQADAQSRKQFAKEYRSSRRELQRSIPFILGCSYFETRERIRYILYGLGLYTGLRKLYDAVR